MIGGGPYFWSSGSYAVGDGTWKGYFAPTSTRLLRIPSHDPVGGQEVTSGFSGTFANDRAEVFGTTLAGTRSLSFRATLKKLVEC